MKDPENTDENVSVGKPADGEGEIELLIEDEIADEINSSAEGRGDEGVKDEPGGSDEAEAGEKGTEEPGELVYDPDENLDRRFVIKHNGQLMEADLKELKALAQKGLNFTHKTMELAKYRQLVETLESIGVTSPDDIVRLVSGQNGETPEPGTTPRRDTVVPDPVSVRADAIASEILSRPDGEAFAEMTRSLPDSAREYLSKDPDSLGRLYNDFHDGVAQRLVPEATKIMALRPELDFVSAYRLAYAGTTDGGASKKASANGVEEPKGKGFSGMADEVLSDDEFIEMTKRLMALE